MINLYDCRPKIRQKTIWSLKKIFSLSHRHRLVSTLTLTRIHTHARAYTYAHTNPPQLIVIYVSERKYYLTCETKEEKDVWLAAINKRIAALDPNAKLKKRHNSSQTSRMQNRVCFSLNGFLSTVHGLIM